MPVDLNAYREEAERFLEKIDREYYLHLSGRKPDLEIDAIYKAHGGLFSSEAVASLREAAAARDGDDEGRGRRYLLAFAFDGLLGQATKREAEEIARLESSLEIPLDGEHIPYRQAHIELANEPSTDRRRELERARNEVLAERINPLHLETFERSRELCREHGWPSYAAAQGELRGIDLQALARQTAVFIDATAGAYPAIIGPRLEAASLPPLGEAGRADIARLLRAAELDALFPQEQLFESFEQTLSSLGLDLDAQSNVHLDAEARETKSPRAFCSPVKVPGEVHLVFAPIGGREDYRALYHEGGHTEHYANTAAEMAYEFRQLGDNSVTESFAFLVEHLVSDPNWLRERLGVEDPDPAVEHSRAFRLVMLRRYSAKLAYELELHGASADLERMPDTYAELLSEAVRVPWPRTSWLADVDDGFYAACYLRAWALETHWRAALEERFGERWFARAEAGEWLEGLWRHGQRLNADELLAEALGEELDFTRLAAEVRKVPH
jgi:hypothetical protein